MATASPRRRSNHFIPFATRGAIIADLPSKPIRRPLATHNVQRLSVKLTIKAPNAIIREPNSAGCHIPFRSIQRPIKIPPTPAPNIIKEYANEGTQRSVSRSAAIGFNDTKSMFGAPRPMVLRIREQKITTQPYGVSMLSFR